MIKQVVQCDICTNSFPIWPLEDIVPPPNWYVLYHGQAHQVFADAKHFCSDECLLQHFGVIPSGQVKGGKR